MKAAAITVPDEQNPAYLFSMTHTDLLVQLVTGKLDPTVLAIRELAARGLDPLKGNWIGFDAAKAKADKLVELEELAKAARS